MTGAGNRAANFKAVRHERADADWYVEPRWCVEQLLDVVSFDDMVILDPCCGAGTILDVFAERGHPVVGSDLVDRGWSDMQAPVDFLTCDERLLIVLGSRFGMAFNPPFKQAEAFVRRALQLRPQRLAVIQQLSFLASRTRHRLFSEFPPSDVLVLSQRPSMPPGHMIAELGDSAFRGGTTDFCWIVWTLPHDRETRLRWLTPGVKA